MNPTSFNRKRVVFALLVFLLIISPLLPMDRAGRSATIAAAQDDPAQPAAVSIFFNPAPISIPDSGPASPSTINVSDLIGVITGLSVTFNGVTHSNPDDLDILLRGPLGETLILMSDAGGTDDLNNITFTITNGGPVLPDDNQISPGTFRPANYDGGDGDTFSIPGPYGNPGPEDGGTDTLNSVFNNTDPNGIWTLFVGDDTPGSSGMFAGGWTLRIITGQIVRNLNDSGPESLRQAIDDALPGDTVFFDPGLTGIINLESELVIDKNLIIGGPGNDVITISGNEITRVFNIQGGASVTIGGVTIANGNADNDLGGGILNAGTLTLSLARLTNNTASDGGGIANMGNGRVTVINSTIADNSAARGGGLFTDSTNTTPTLIFGSTFSNNMASEGGGLNILNGPVNITNSTFSNNSATTGGGLFNNSTGNLTINSSTITSNDATSSGGGLMTGDVIIIKNTIIAQNTAPVGPDASGAVTSQGHNFVGNNSDATISPMTGDQIGTPGNPLDPNLTPLQDNGGPTLTHMPIQGSLVIDAGNNAGAPTADQRGLPRNLSGPVIDIGAIEHFIRILTDLEITRIAPTSDPQQVSITARLTKAETGQPVSSQSVFHRLLGDVDGDSVRGTTDINGFTQVNLPLVPSSTGEYRAVSDFNGDGQFDLSDVVERFRFGQDPPRSPGIASPQGGGCQFLIFSADESFAANGGMGTFNVTTFPQDCNWTAVSNDPWIQITSGANGTGDGVVNYTVAANTDPAPRTGTITAAGLTFTVLQGAAFLDVPESNIFYTFIGKLSARGVTQGCGGGNYCPTQLVTREQMAAFIIRALGDFNPPEPAMQRFADVPPANIFYRFIEQMALRQITLGCGGGNYCPSDPVLREQMAAFMIRAVGETNPILPFAQRFADVPQSNPFYRFIDRMAVRRITLGCGGGNYCPSDSVTREQMAAFLVRAFNL